MVKDEPLEKKEFDFVNYDHLEEGPEKEKTGRRIRKCILVTVLVFSLLSLLVPAAAVLFIRRGAHRQRIYRPAARTRKPTMGQFLWMTPRTDGFNGFNNQLVSVYEAIRCAQIHNRTVVLPLIYENVRFDTSARGDGPYPFEDYFDIRGLDAIVPYTTPARLARKGVGCSEIVYKPEINKKIGRPFPAHRLLREQYALRFRLKLVANASLNGQTDAGCVDDSLCAHSQFARPEEFGAYSRYDLTGQGYSVARSTRFRAIRAAVRPGRTQPQSCARLTSNRRAVQRNACSPR